MGYQVTETIPHMDPVDAGRFRYGIELELKEWPPVADKLLGTLHAMSDDPDFYGFNWEMYDPLPDMSDDPLFSEPLPNMSDDSLYSGFEFGAYDPMEVASARFKAYEMAVDYQFKVREYQAFPTLERRNELLELAKSIHPYPLSPKDPVYWY